MNSVTGRHIRFYYYFLNLPVAAILIINMMMYIKNSRDVNIRFIPLTKRPPLGIARLPLTKATGCSFGLGFPLPVDLRGNFDTLSILSF